jgi:hypothetical protein
MPEPNEVELLRTQIAEVTEKSRTRKARIAELESQLADATGKLAVSETALHEATVGAPLRQLAATVSPVPELWTAEFQKHYKLQLKDGKLSVLDLEGKPVVGGDGKEPIAFEPNAIAKLVTDDDNAISQTFKHITAVSFSSGGGASGTKEQTLPGTDYRPKPKTPDAPRAQFGLR